MLNLYKNYSITTGLNAVFLITLTNSQCNITLSGCNVYINKNRNLYVKNKFRVILRL